LASKGTKGSNMTRASIALGTVLVTTVLLTGCPTQSLPQCQTAPAGTYGIRMLRVSTPTAGCDNDTGTPAQIGDTWTFDMYENAPDGGIGSFGYYVLGFSTFLGQPDPNVGSSPLYGKNSFTTLYPTASASTPAGGTCQLGPISFNGGAAGRYDVTNMQWQEGAYYQGDSFKGDVTWSNGSTCTAQYSMVGLFPVATCGSNADCDPFNQPPGSVLVNPAYTQNCVIGPKWVQDIVAQVSGPLPDGGVDTETGVCYFVNEWPSNGGYDAGAVPP
ncbi:MAG: hypothetical protein ACXWLA_13120, partial [Myxococcaceae bacterium]